MAFMRGGATVLVAEDDVAFGQALADLLLREGHAVDLVTDGREALRTIRRLGDRLDLLICDLLLPQVSGFEVIRELVEMELDLPVLAMTGVYEDIRDVHALRSLGVKGYLHKSAPFEHLLFRVNNLLFPSLDNQRGNPRVAVAVPVQFRIEDVVHYGTTYNLSESGVYVRTPETLTPGERIRVALGLPTARRMVQLQAEVMHSASPREVKGSAYPAGFGARFHDVSALAAAAVRNFVVALHREETSGENLGRPVFELVEEEEPAPV